MTREFDKDYWERHWEQPYGNRPEAATKNAPNPYLIRATSSLVPGTALADLYPGVLRAKINSIHHQAVKDLGRDLQVQALGEPDGIIEAIRWSGPSYVLGIQWHPEFLALRAHDPSELDGGPIRREFLACARARRGD